MNPLSQMKSIPLSKSKPDMSELYILIVDDDPSLLKLTQRMFKYIRPKARIITAATGSLALEKIAKHPVNMLVTDYNLPALNGVELAQRAISLMPQLRIILMSGHDEDSIRPQLKDVQIDGYLNKPFALKDLSTAVGSLGL